MTESPGTAREFRLRPWLVFRVLLSSGFTLIGIIGSLILIIVAAVLPQIPRQRAIALIESRGGSISYENSLPEWAYSLCGEEWLRRYETVSDINLDGTEVDDAVVPRLLELKEARTVWLNSARITDRGALLLRSFPSITSLDLGDTNLTERSIVPMLEHHTDLETLWLQHTPAMNLCGRWAVPRHSGI